MADDKIKHMIGGAAAALAMGVLLLIAKFAHPALACAIAGPVFGWGIERYQAIRREGVASRADILYTAAPFEIVALAWYFLT
jgi:hypothetical protein